MYGLELSGWKLLWDRLPVLYQSLFISAVIGAAANSVNPLIDGFSRVLALSGKPSTLGDDLQVLQTPLLIVKKFLSVISPRYLIARVGFRGRRGKSADSFRALLVCGMATCLQLLQWIAGARAALMLRVEEHKLLAGADELLVPYFERDAAMNMENHTCWEGRAQFSIKPEEIKLPRDKYSFHPVSVVVEAKILPTEVGRGPNCENCMVTVTNGVGKFDVILSTDWDEMRIAVISTLNAGGESAAYNLLQPGSQKNMTIEVAKLANLEYTVNPKKEGEHITITAKPQHDVKTRLSEEFCSKPPLSPKLKPPSEGGKRGKQIVIGTAKLTDLPSWGWLLLGSLTVLYILHIFATLSSVEPIEMCNIVAREIQGGSPCAMDSIRSSRLLNYIGIVETAGNQTQHLGFTMKGARRLIRQLGKRIDESSPGMYHVASDTDPSDHFARSRCRTWVDGDAQKDYQSINHNVVESQCQPQEVSDN